MHATPAIVATSELVGFPDLSRWFAAGMAKTLRRAAFVHLAARLNIATSS